jgi:DHA1 family purine base/nucleoside efflux pump-like MFS transporter
MRKSTFIILCLEGAILSFNVAAAAALVPSIAKDFNISQFVAGKIVWLYMIPYGISALLYGPLVRAFDAKNIELVCLLLFSLANLFVGISRDISGLFIARFFMGVFGASVIPLALILIASKVDSQDRGKYVGLFFGATFIASLAGLFLSGVMNWRMIFIIPAVLGLMLCIYIYFYLPSFQELKSGFKINYLAVFKDRKILSLFGYILFISLLYHGIQQWLGVYFSKRFEFDQFIISALITLTSFSGIFGEGFGGWLSDKIGRIKTVNLGIVFMILSLFLLTLKQPLWVLMLIMIIWGLGWTFNHVGVSTMLTDLPRKFLNESASLNSSVRFIAGGIGSVIGGILMQKSLNLYFIIFGAGLILLLLLAKNLLALE